MPRIYLDHAASTPLDPRVLRAMEPYFLEKFGNPGSLHSYGQEAIAAVDASRQLIAKAIGAQFDEVVFTGGATEANNMALRGAVRHYMGHGKKVCNIEAATQSPRIIISAIEHESVFETARDLQDEGAEIIYLPVSKEGKVNDLRALRDHLNERTAIVSVMMANNEIGTMQPIKEIGAIIANFRAELKKERPDARCPLFHTDAAQTFPFFGCDVNDLGIDMMTLSAHKMYGPKGIGAVYVRRQKKEKGEGRKFNIEPTITGGGQEFGLRSGTENVPLIVGFAKAVEIAAEKRDEARAHVEKISEKFLAGIKKIANDAEVNGVAALSASGSREGRLPHIINIYFPGHEAQYLLTRFDRMGLAVSSGSACRARAVESSYVIEALGHSKERAKSSVRVSFGRETTGEEISEALKIVEGVVR